MSIEIDNSQGQFNDTDKVEEFGKDTLLKRPGQPSEVAPAYVFLASNDVPMLLDR